MKTNWLLCVTAALAGILTGCGPQAAPPAPAGGAGERSFDTRGVVRQIAQDRAKAVIRHEEIPGYMPRMTMELTVRNPAELAGIQVGDEITFRLHATTNTHWIDTLKRIGVARPEITAAQPLFVPQNAPELKPGDILPDQEFLSETGQPMRLVSLRGQAVAFTFFFTRCPLPDFCPLMNRNFSEARELLLRQSGAPTNWQFLCVSFDAEFDRPAVLRTYAGIYRGKNPDRWLFAAASPDALAVLAPRLDLQVAREAGGFSHNLRTIVMDVQGRIHRQFDGNQWTPQQLADALVEAARKR